MLRRIKALGVSIAMDDFGTGYSSLSTLQAFPFDKLKIDKSFVDKIVLAAAGQRHRHRRARPRPQPRSIPVLAEGVENDEQLSFLSSGKCEQAQGFLIARPLPLSQIRDIVYATSAPTTAATSIEPEEEPLQQAG